MDRPAASAILPAPSSDGLGAGAPLDERERVLAAVVRLCEGAPTLAEPERRQALGEVFLRLVSEAEHDIRRRLAERIADAAWAPRALMAALALDDIDIARPVIALSPVLEDADLMAVIARATLEHRIALASRPDLSPDVANGLVDAGEPPTLTALAANARTRLPPDAMQRLVAAARVVAAVRAPLARRPELSAELATGLYAWVGDTLRRALEARFALDPAALAQAAAAATAAAAAGAPDPRFALEDQESEDRLVAKLEASGQLRPGYLLRVLREGRLALFEAAMAALVGGSRTQVRRALDADTPVLLALACAGVGVDRSAFPTVLALVRDLNGGRPSDGAGSAQQVAEAFARHDRGSAAALFRDVADGVVA